MFPLQEGVGAARSTIHIDCIFLSPQPRSYSLAPYPRWTVEDRAGWGQRRPIGDFTALALPGDVAAARARDRADQHSPRPQPMPAWTYFGWLDHPLTASAD